MLESKGKLALAVVLAFIVLVLSLATIPRIAHLTIIMTVKSILANSTAIITTVLLSSTITPVSISVYHQQTAVGRWALLKSEQYFLNGPQFLPIQHLQLLAFLLREANVKIDLVKLRIRTILTKTS